MKISITYGRGLLKHTADSNLARACVSLMPVLCRSYEEWSERWLS